MVLIAYKLEPPSLSRRCPSVCMALIAYKLEPPSLSRRCPSVCMALIAYKLPFSIVIIADRPVFISEKSTRNTVYSSIGGHEEVTLTCVFDGFPVPRVRFNIFGEELNNSGITYTTGSASYRFLIESQSDFGFYTCKGTNSRGSTSHTIEVHERGISAMIFLKPSLNLLGPVPA